MATCLRVRDWSKHFENNRTRELKALTWFPAPNRYDGDGYTELLDHENGASHYAAWMCIAGVASRCDVRGTLLRDAAGGVQTPHDERSLSRISRIPVAVFEEAIPRLVAIGWLERIPLENNGVAAIPQEGATAPQETDVALRKSAYGMEGKEGNGREGKESSRRTLRFDEQDLELAQWMFGLIQAMQPERKPPNLEAWANSFRLMREVDGRAPPEVRSLYEWINRDAFWRTNVLSPDTLREKWDDLQLKRKNDRHGNKPSAGKWYDPNDTSGGDI